MEDNTSNIYYYTIKFSGINSLFILNNCYMFMKHFLNVYLNEELISNTSNIKYEFDFGDSNDKSAIVNESVL